MAAARAGRGAARGRRPATATARRRRGVEGGRGAPQRRAPVVCRAARPRVRATRTFPACRVDAMPPSKLNLRFRTGENHMHTYLILRLPIQLCGKCAGYCDVRGNGRQRHCRGVDCARGRPRAAAPPRCVCVWGGRLASPARRAVAPRHTARGRQRQRPGVRRARGGGRRRAPPATGCARTLRRLPVLFLALPGGRRPWDCRAPPRRPCGRYARHTRCAQWPARRPLPSLLASGPVLARAAPVPAGSCHHGGARPATAGRARGWARHCGRRAGATPANGLGLRRGLPVGPEGPLQV